jgi:hypothetical protein
MSRKMLDYGMISTNIEILLVENKMTKGEFGKKMGFSSGTTVTKRCRGKGWVLEEMARASKVLGRSVEDIFFKKISTNVEKIS